jgi:hypothetical protein
MKATATRTENSGVAINPLRFSLQLRRAIEGPFSPEKKPQLTWLPGSNSEEAKCFFFSVFGGSIFDAEEGSILNAD